MAKVMFTNSGSQDGEKEERLVVDANK